MVYWPFQQAFIGQYTLPTVYTFELIAIFRITFVNFCISSNLFIIPPIPLLLKIR